MMVLAFYVLVISKFGLIAVRIELDLFDSFADHFLSFSSLQTFQ
jgi:hypothetical protein